MNMKRITTKTIFHKPGIYFIKNVISKKIYIGQSVDVYKRLILHRHKLLNNIHENPHLQKSFNKHKINAFKCGCIEYCNINILTNKERFYINNQTNKLYNIREASDSVQHYDRAPITEITRQKLINAKKGKFPSNLHDLQQSNRRKIAHYNNENLIQIFSSCIEAAEYFKMTAKVFNQYIGKIRKSKYFKTGEYVKYYNERKEVML
jgi:hypothetical protein